MKLRGCNSLNESEILRGQTLLVSSTDRPEVEEEDEFLVQVCHIAPLSSSFQVLYLSQAIRSSPVDQQDSGLCWGDTLHCQDVSLSGPSMPVDPALLSASVTMHSRAGCELQDLIDCEVLLQKDDSLIGRVLDVYDGTGRSCKTLHMRTTMRV